tara:strand:- start:185581 stop:186618 length:1038 start_codon:yes stop_codon:yes gene_type:complete
MKRCIELAKNGLGTTSPNPSVGAVLVYNDKIIGEGYTSAYGGNHAEVNAINSVTDKSLLSKSTMYVSLEPCNHFGKTPPCSDLIIESAIPNVVIGCVDPFEKVAGKGIQKLSDHGCNVIVGVLEEACLAANKRFFTFHTRKRPYIILKWAETKDGFIDVDREVQAIENAKPNWITTENSRRLVHKWRSEEDAILVGTTTVINDNPKLTIRDWKGNNPVRVILDRTLRIPKSYHIYNGEVKTLIITEMKVPSEHNILFEQIDFSKALGQQICAILYKHKLQSVLVEGGRQTLDTFIDTNLWDEARVFIGDVVFIKGLKAPVVSGDVMSLESIETDLLKFVKNKVNS